MPTKITYKVDLAVEKGPTSAVTQDIEVDAYDLLKFDVPGGDANTPGTITIDVQPSAVSRIRLLSISSSKYSDKLTYDVDASGTSVALDAPQLFIGGGSVGRIGATAKQFVFTNTIGLNDKASVQILVGRKATP